MKKSLRLVNAASLSFLLLFSAVEAHAFDIGKMLDFGKSTGNSTDIVEGLFGDSDLGQLYKAYTLEFSDEDAYYIGRAAAAAMLKKYSFYENKELESYLNKICQTLVINSDEQIPYNGYHVKILGSDEINAFSTPGGHILVTRGLIDCADTEDALAAVIAHEIAHIQLKHSLDSIKASRFKDTLDALDSAFSDDSMEDVSDDIISSMVGSGFSQGQEYDADEKAVQLMAAAGYQPSAMISMLEEMKSFEKSASKSGFFKTHPSPSSRITNIKSHVRKAEKNLENTMEYREERYDEAVR